MLSPSTLRRLACAFFCLGSSFAWSQSQPVFPVLHYEPYAVASPLAMAEGDLNGDGITDTLYAAASATPGSSTLTSAPRDASGATLAPLAAGTVPCTANSLLLADLNKDNRLDAIVTCSEDKVAVLAGNGDGAFQGATIFSITKAASAAAADLNGDGYPDIVVATNTGTGDSVFAILVNAGTGTVAFAAPQVVDGSQKAAGSSQLFITDLNGDGKPDIVAGGNPDLINARTAWAFYGNGDGTFHAETAAGFYLGNNLAFADFDGDGKIDSASIIANLGIAVLNEVDIRFLYTNKPSTAIRLLPGPVRVQAVDVNGDGHPDVVLTGAITTVLLNDGAAHLSSAGSYATPGTFYTARKGSAGTDLVFSTPRGLYTMHGDTQGRFDGLSAYPSSDQIATADFNKDGVTDVFAMTDIPFMGQSDSYVTRSIFSRGNGTFVEFSTNSGPLESFPVAGDFDADGLVDRVDVNPTNATPYGYNPDPQARLAWYQGKGNGAFAANGPSTLLGVKLATGAVPGDFDRDGKLDIAVSYFDSSVSPINSGMVLVRGNGDGTFIAPSAPLYSTSSTAAATPFASDLDNDGDLDLVWRNSAFINDGSSTFAPVPLSAAGAVLAVGDLNGDSFPDLVIGNTVHAGNGDGTFQPAAFATIATPAGATFISASIGDLDGDGHPDVVIQHMTDMAGFTVAYGDGAGNFTADPNTYTTGSKTPVLGTLVRLNNQATTHTDRLDYLVASDSAIISLLNQKNPPPGDPLKIPTQLVLTSSLSNPAPLQPTTLTVQLTGASPTGTVTFTSSDGTVLGKVSNDVSPWSIDYQFPQEGTYIITASYSGDSVNTSSVSAPVTISVAKKTPTLSFSNYDGPTFYTGYNSGFFINFAGAFNPTGRITISSAGQTIQTVPANIAGASIGYRFPAAGNYTLTASYPGDASNLPATATRSVSVVDGPDFTITASPTTATVKAGETATYTLTLTSLRNYGGYINFTCRPACPAYSLYLEPGKTATAKYTLQTNPAGTGGGAAPSLSYGPAAAALLLFGLAGRFRRRLPQWQRLGLFAVILAAGLFSLAGCSSGSGSSGSAGNSGSSGSGPGTSYYLAITASDQSSGPQHTVNLTLVIQ
jgi:hypothetical protein